MSDIPLSRAFAAALQHCEKQHGRGFQKHLSAKSGVRASYINDILKERKSCPEEQRRILAKSAITLLGYDWSYEDFLSFGRHILSGGDPEDWTRLPAIGTIEGTLPTLTPTPTKKVPLISWVQAGAWSEVVDEYHPDDADEWVTTYRHVSENTFALRVAGDSMEPEFTDGETIIVDPAVQADHKKFIIAKIEDNGENGEATFKQIIKDGSSIYLKPLNPRYPIIDMTGRKFRIVGVVVEKRKEY